MEQPIPLSQAIRLGAMIKRQAFGFIDEVVEIKVTLLGQEIVLATELATCALGAAFDAIGKLSVYEDLEDSRYFPILAVMETCPVTACSDVCMMSAESLDNVIQHLNDDHYWTREQVAEWVEVIERRQFQPMRKMPAKESALVEA